VIEDRKSASVRGLSMQRRDVLKGTLSSLALLSSTGCVTKKLYETLETHDTQYDETALSFLVTEDGSKLVVLGEKYHYIFSDISPSLTQVLGSQLRTVVAADLANFRVRRDNVVTGDYTLHLSEQASDEQRRSAAEAGFVVPGLTLPGHLKGVRYSAEGFPSPPETQRFTRPYVVSITEDAESKLAAKIMLTPLTVAADGVIVLGAVVLILLLAYLRVLR
jgi:hypothetical protein